MSVQDFISGAFSRIDDDDEDLEDVVLDTITEAHTGLRARWHYLRSRPSGVTTVSHLDTTIDWRVDSVADARRGAGLASETPVAEWFFAGDPAGERIWDVGAHQGNFACLAVALGATVRAFEPTPRGYARTVENLELNTGVEAVSPYIVDERALSDHSADGETCRVPACSPTASVDDADGEYEAPLVAGDSVPETPDRIKIDVEGHERAVLRGLTETLPDVDRVVAEVHDGGDGQGCLDILQAAGFNVRAIPCSRPHTFLGAWRA